MASPDLKDAATRIQSAAAGLQQLATNHGNPAASAFTIRLQPVKLADYLNTKEMAVRTGENSIRFAPFHRWAEPLDAGIRRVLAANLRTEPPVQAVITDEVPPPHFPVYTVSIRLLACEGSSSSSGASALFEAFWQIIGPGPKDTVVGEGVFRAAPASWTPVGYGQLAQDLSRALLVTISHRASTTTS